MPTYRYYCLDGAGHLYGADWFDAASDEQAIAFVQEKHPDGHCEVWKGKALLASIRPERRQA